MKQTEATIKCGDCLQIRRATMRESYVVTTCQHCRSRNITVFASRNAMAGQAGQPKPIQRH